MSGSRMEHGDICVKCGNPIIGLNPALKMCSTCEKLVCVSVADRIKYRKERTGLVKRYRIKIGKLKGVKRKGGK
ncbi:MAG: hypothetical protein A2W01_11230 [Candidatus Solincola sediminis]|nr:MAG: hypothetical protein A2W01_11230 [Candidatus Solincola sediminis]